MLLIKGRNPAERDRHYEQEYLGPEDPKKGRNPANRDMHSEQEYLRPEKRREETREERERESFYE